MVLRIWLALVEVWVPGSASGAEPWFSVEELHLKT